MKTGGAGRNKWTGETKGTTGTDVWESHICTECNTIRRERLTKLQALAFDDDTDDDDDVDDVHAPAATDDSAQPAQAPEHVEAQGLDSDRDAAAPLSAPAVCRSGAVANACPPISSNASSGHGRAQEAEDGEARSAGKMQAGDCAPASAASERNAATHRAAVASAKPVVAGRSAKGGKVGSYFERFKCLEQIFTWFSGREHDDEVPSCLLVSVYSCFRCLYYWGRAGRQPA